MTRWPVLPSVARASSDLLVRDTMVRALAVLRVVVLVNTLALGWYRRDNLVHPGAAFVVFAVITLWTGLALWAYAADVRRRAPLLVIDLAVALTAIGLSPWIKGEAMRATLPGFWVMGAVLAWSVQWRWVGGLVAAVLVCAVDLAARVSVDQTNYGNIFLLLIGGPLVGFLSGLLQDMARERDVAERAAAAAAERARLARVVHDGVLQVLTLVQRRGNELGGGPDSPWGELGRLAGEQETALRALVQTDHDDEPVGGVADLRDLVTGLQARTTPRVTVAVPGSPVPVSSYVAEELVAAVRACLHNITEHVGPEAPAWVLLEDLGDRVAVTVRDDGPGIPDDRLAAAVADGRLGVVESVRGRITALGGTATLVSAPGRGTEWELEVPKGDGDG